MKTRNLLTSVLTIVLSVVAVGPAVGQNQDTAIAFALYRTHILDNLGVAGTSTGFSVPALRVQALICEKSRQRPTVFNNSSALSPGKWMRMTHAEVPVGWLCNLSPRSDVTINADVQGSIWPCEEVSLENFQQEGGNPPNRAERIFSCPRPPSRPGPAV